MKCIVPLAGPDIYNNKYGLKPAYEIDGEPLLYKALNSRCWYGNVIKEDDLIFVMRNFEQLKGLQQLITSLFPKGRQLIIPDLTRGALMTTLAGTSIIEDYSETIVVDLVDILFTSDFKPEEIFEKDESISGIIPYFESKHPQYSYLEIDNYSNVLRTREKKVISNYASAGVYFFKNLSIFLASVQYSIDNESYISFKSKLFLCPSFNGIINEKYNVKAIEVNVVNQISLLW